MSVVFEQEPRPAAFQLRRREFAKEHLRVTPSMRKLRRSARSWRMFDELAFSSQLFSLSSGLLISRLSSFRGLFSESWEIGLGEISEVLCSGLAES